MHGTRPGPSNLPSAYKKQEGSLVDRIYENIKNEIFEFYLLPGDRFSENEIAARMFTSRTPVREALYRLQREGFLEFRSRNGWQVRPFDFRHFEELYDVRIVLELASVERLCALPEIPESLDVLSKVWLVGEKDRLTDGQEVCSIDERFHEILVESTGNREMAAIHHGITERIRIIRRLDFTKEGRLTVTYSEHAAILTAILERSGKEACSLLRSHIESSKNEVRNITFHKLHTARAQAEH